MLIALSASRTLAPTTLRMARWWALAAGLAWACVFTAEQFLQLASPEWSSLLWYGAAVLALCPPIAVLGARRPGARAWNWFVLLPLLAVLGWPTVTVWTTGPAPGGLLIETPALIGFLLVLLMGAGNYVGTRYAFSAALFALAECAVLATLSQATRDLLPSADAARIAATLLLCTAAVAGAIPARRLRPDASPYDRLWLDFRDHFGIVWARRVQDRVNARAAAESWPARLESLGFLWSPGVDDSARIQAVSRIDHTIRWHLRRFVDEEWIDRRLGTPPAS